MKKFLPIVSMMLFSVCSVDIVTGMERDIARDIAAVLTRYRITGAEMRTYRAMRPIFEAADRDIMDVVLRAADGLDPVAGAPQGRVPWIDQVEANRALQLAAEMEPDAAEARLPEPGELRHPRREELPRFAVLDALAARDLVQPPADPAAYQERVPGNPPPAGEAPLVEAWMAQEPGRHDNEDRAEQDEPEPPLWLDYGPDERAREEVD